MARKTKFIKGLKTARFGFSDLLDHLKAGDDVVIIEYNRAREPIGGYRMTPLSTDEALDIAKNEPSLNIPKPLAIPSVSELPLPPKAQ